MVPDDLQEYSICSMYRDGVSLRSLEVAFDRSQEELIRVLSRHGVVRPEPGESWEALVDRVRDDVKHRAA
jgi:hypothetical protein